MLDRPGARSDGLRATGGSGGRRCSSIKERGACLTWVALLLSCFVGTASAGFLFFAANMLFFFCGRGADGLSKDQRGDPIGSAEDPVPPFDENSGLIPPILRSNEAYRCFAVGRSRGSGTTRRSVTNLALCLARSVLMPSRAILSFSASSSTARCISSRNSQYRSYQQSGCSGNDISSDLGISRLINSCHNSASSRIRWGDCISRAL